MSKEYLEALDYVWYNYYTEEELSEDEINEFVKHLKIVETALKRLETIDNAEPSEALDCLKRMGGAYLLREDKTVVEALGLKEEFSTIKAALLKSQVNTRSEELLQKYYQEGITLDSVRALKLRIEALEKDLEKDRTYKALLNGNQYELVKRYDDYEYHRDYITLQKKPNVSIFFYEWNKEIFNDLHLERVEE